MKPICKRDDKKFFVSIIIPVFNAEKYLTRCLQSCLMQTLDNVEIIVIDDASTDDSPSIINNYANGYPNKVIPIYFNQNKKQGVARNYGIKMARGDYVFFVDADDWIEPNTCYELFFAAKSADADMVGGDYYISSLVKEDLITLNYNSVDFSGGGAT